MPFSDDTMYTGADNTYISKMPFFYLMENIFPASRALAMLETFLLTGFAFVSLYITALYFLKKAKPKLLLVAPLSEKQLHSAMRWLITI